MVDKQLLLFRVEFVVFDVDESDDLALALFASAAVEVPVLQLTLLHSFVLCIDVYLFDVLGFVGLLL